MRDEGLAGPGAPRLRVMITGGKGMLGRTLLRRLAAHELFVADLPETDITRPESLAAAMAAFRPDAVVHCAAMTQVDACEGAREKAFLLNGAGSRNVAEAARAAGARLVAISTDYVFDGRSGPYGESDEPRPATVYGASKLAGERAVAETLPGAHAILRTAWLYGPGGPSFVHTMLRLGADAAGGPVKVVDDQTGNPTSTDALAGAVAWTLAHPALTGVFHAVCEGATTWYGFTKEIFRRMGLARPVQPCTTAEFPRPAPRPADSRLVNTRLRASGFRMPEWRAALADFLDAEKERSSR